MTETPELSACPFCGGKPVGWFSDSCAIINCTECEVGLVRCKTIPSHIKIAILDWNLRTGVSLPDEARKERQQATEQIQELQRERDEARDRCRALDAVETDLWAFACAVTRSEAPKGIRDKAAELVLKYDELNPPDLPWLDDRPKVALGNPPDLFAPCYSPSGWIDPDTDLDAE